MKNNENIKAQIEKKEKKTTYSVEKEFSATKHLREINFDYLVQSSNNFGMGTFELVKSSFINIDFT